MHVKIGDFGLATEITREDERKKTLCGTPNYIAPEILTKKGHGFEVDIWSTGKFSALNTTCLSKVISLGSESIYIPFPTAYFVISPETLFNRK